MNPRHERTGTTLLVSHLFSIISLGLATAQDIEPRRWTYMPVGTNILGAGYAYTSGELYLDPALRIEDARFQLHTAVTSFNHYFDLFGMTARADLQLPFVSGRWKGLVNGEKDSVRREGLADPRIRFSFNFIGAPALQAEEYLEYRKEHSTNTTVGAALAIRLPLGEYLDDKLINLGENRFAFRPQIGVLHTQGPWSFELTGSVFLFTDNDDLLGDMRLEQDPLYTVQAHVVRTFESHIWLAASIAYGWHGETTVDGDRKDDERSNLLLGCSLGCPIASNQSIRLGYARTDTLTDTGSDSHSLLLTWAMRF